MQLLPDVPLQVRLGHYSRYLAIVVVVLAGLVLLGWQFDMSLLKRPLPTVAAMNPVTALTFIFAAISFLLIMSSPSGKRTPWPAYGLAGLVFLVGMITVLNYTGWFSGRIDQLLFPGKIQAEITEDDSHNRMAPNTAFCFMLTGITLLLPRTHGRRKGMALQYLAIAILLAAWFSMLGYIYRVQSFYGVFSYVPMAFHTALGFLCMALAFLFARSGEGMMRQFTSIFSGSITARLLVPAAIFIPSVLGLLRLLGDWDGIYDNEFGVVIYTICVIIIFLVIAWYIATVLNKRDVQKKQTEDALRDSEKEISAIFTAGPDAIIVIDEAGKVIKWNPEAEKLFQWTADEATGKLLSDFVVPGKYREAHAKGMRKFLATGEGNVFGKTVEITALKKGNAEFDIALRIAPVKIKDSYMFVGFVRDITERKRIEQRLRSFNEELTRQVEEKTREVTEIFDRVTDAVIALDKNFCYTYLNDKAGELIRRDPATLIGKNVWKEFPDAVGSSTYEAFIKAMREQQYIFNTDYYEPLNLWQENYIYPSPNGLSIFIRDITTRKLAEQALKENEAKYRTFVAEAVDAILVLSGKELRYIEANKKASELLGYSIEELLQLSPRDLLFPDDMAPTPYGLLDAGEAVRMERVLRRKDGTGVEVESSARRLPDGNYLAFLRDITERKRSEKEMLRLNDELRRLTSHLQKVREDERTHIAREIHDELGQQLTVMKMDIAWLNKKIEDPPPALKGKINELLGMVDTTVKTVRRIASELRPSMLDDLGLIPAMEWHLDEFEKRSGIRKRFQLPATDLPLSDDIKIGLFRIFQESLTNVARHSQARQVNISLEQVDKKVILTIRDDGLGFRKENAVKKTLGILGMKERTHMLGGEYTITGTPGEGTTVTVSIPLNGNGSGK